MTTPRPFAAAKLLCAIAITGLSLPAPAIAAEDAETMVLRLAFEDCLGWVKSGEVPFQGLAQRAPTDDFLAQVAIGVQERSPKNFSHSTVELLSPRYLASWTDAPAYRTCFIQEISVNSAASDWPGQPSIDEVLLPLKPDFLERADQKAAGKGFENLDAPNMGYWVANVPFPVAQGSNGVISIKIMMFDDATSVEKSRRLHSLSTTGPKPLGVS